MIKFVTSNQRKFRELSAITGLDMEMIDAELQEIQGTYQEIVAHKLKQAREMFPTGPIMVEDTGLFIQSLNGLPGEYTKQFLERVGPLGIYRMCPDADTDSESCCTYPDEIIHAIATCAIGFSKYENDSMLMVGEVNGTVVSPRGDNEFGFDTIFVPYDNNDDELTFAQMSFEEKNKCSHRFEAGKQLTQHINVTSKLRTLLTPTKFNDVEEYHDITQLLLDPYLFERVVCEMGDIVETIMKKHNITDEKDVVLAGLESRGFIFAAAIAVCDNPITMVRKAGKMPNASQKITYEKEYGTDSLEVSKLMNGKTVILIDDIVVTGNSIAAATEAFRQVGANVIGSVVLMKKNNDNKNIHALLNW